MIELPEPLVEDFAPMSNVAEKLGDQTNRRLPTRILSLGSGAVAAIERFIAERNALVSQYISRW